MSIIIGIIVQFYLNVWQFGFIKFIFLVLSLTFIFFITKEKIIRTVNAFIIFFLIGLFIVFLNDDRNYKNHYTKNFHKENFVVLTIKKVLKPGNYYHKYEAEVTKVDTFFTCGKVLLNINKEKYDSILKVEDKIYLSPQFKKLIPPLNPHQFNYKSYLAKQGVYHQVFVNRSEFLKLKSKEITLLGISAEIRAYIQKALKKHSFSNDEFAVISALLLGQRQDISKELLTDYSRAGAIHILAVSGLHVGIILLILSYLFKPLEFFKHGKIVKALIIVLFLWMFAFLAGLSASVVRAVTMFTFIAIGQSFNRKNTVSFSLISSMLFLLILKPMFLFDVGFQLSYLAVFGIIWVQPKLYAVWKPKWKIIDFFWKLFTVSIAAQVGILPLSIFYFNQFPGLFIASNLVIIPFLGIILMGGILVIFLAVLNILPQFLAIIYSKIISYMNAFVSWISHQEEFLLQDLYLSFLLMIGCYVTVFSGLHFFIRRNVKTVLTFFISIILIQVIILIEKYDTNATNEFLVFHKSRKSIIGNRIGEDLFLHHNLDSLINVEKSIVNYQRNERIKAVKEENFKNVISIKNSTILIVDSLGIYNISGLKKPMVVIKNSPKINLVRLLKVLKPTQVVADGSNYKSYVLNWAKICELENIPFHYTGQKGAFIVEY